MRSIRNRDDAFETTTERQFQQQNICDTYRHNSQMVTTVLFHQKKHTLPCALRHIKLCLIQIN